MVEKYKYILKYHKPKKINDKKEDVCIEREVLTRELTSRNDGCRTAPS